MPLFNSTSLVERIPSAGSMKWPSSQPRVSRPSSAAFPRCQLLVNLAHLPFDGRQVHPVPADATESPKSLQEREQPLVAPGYIVDHVSQQFSVQTGVLAQRRCLPVSFDLSAVAGPELLVLDDDEAGELEVPADEIQAESGTFGP